MKIISVIAIVVVIVFSFVVFFVSPAKKNALSGAEGEIAPSPAKVSSTERTSVPLSQQTVHSESTKTPANIDAAEIGLDTDPELIAEIERDMQFSVAPEGDVAHMSPEAETSQLKEEAFPGIAPDPNMTMPGNISPDDTNMYENIGRPLEKNTKMDDLPRH